MIAPSFRSDEAGAVTVDWVVLTAAIVGLGAGAMGIVSAAGMDTATNIKSSLTAMHLNANDCARNPRSGALACWHDPNKHK
ncbi:MAG: hypothetical protein ACU0CO_08255 [Shimia sp.]